MKKHIIAMALLSACITACSDAEITPSELDCSASDDLPCFTNTAIQRCVKGKLMVTECGEDKYCENNVCVKRQPVTMIKCTSDVGLTCASETSVSRCVRGGVQSIECDEGQFCYENQCRNSLGTAETCDAKTRLKCASNTSKTVCVNGIQQVEACGMNQLCMNNVCRDVASRPECDASSVLMCASETSMMQCVSGMLREKPCGENKICRNNKCEAKPVQPECAPSTKLYCASNTSYHECVDGVIQTKPCGANQICQDNVCVNTPECDANTTLNCATETSFNQCVNGKITAKSCGSNQICKNNKCEAKTTVVTECDSKTVMACATDTSVNRCVGGKITPVECNSNRVCRDNLCVKKSDIAGLCDSSTVLSCASETAMNKCVGGKVQAEACGQNSVCKDNKCESVTNTSEPQVGDPCTIDTCVGNQPYYCGSNKKYFINEDAPCTSDQICEVMDGKDARCLEKCSHENDVARVCGSVYMLLYSSEATCTRFADGKLGMVIDESSNNETIWYCDYGCEEGLCINQEMPPTVEDKGQPCDESYGYNCDGNNLVYCNYYSQVDVVTCPGLCKPLGNDEKDGYCVAAETCTPDSIRYTCSGIDDDVDVMYTYRCRESNDGKYYYFSINYGYCWSGTCDTSTGTCDEY